MTSANVRDVGAADFQQSVVEESRQRPVVADFWASWCGPCLALGPVLEKLASEFQGGFLLAKIDVDANPELASQFGIRSIPNVKVFKDGRVVDEMAGALPESQVRDFLHRHCPSEADRRFESAMKQLSAGVAVRPELEAVLQLDPAHAGALVELARLLLAEGDLKGAQALLDRVPYLSPLADQAARLKEGLAFHEICAREGGPMVCTERARLNAADLQARYANGCCLAAAGRYREALEEFLAVVLRDKNYLDGTARKAMLAVFSIVGERSEMADEYRKKLAMALY
jgi:putative thioredoxin